MFQALSLPAVLHFARIEVRASERRVLVDGAEVRIGGRALDLLFVLLEHRERTMSKSELLDLIWPGLVVEENNLQVQMSHLRKVFGGAAISTIPGRGYRFTLQPDALVETAVAGVSSAAPLAPKAAAASLIGRETELCELEAEIRLHALVSVVGAGGIGKTRLAQAVMARLRASFGLNAWWVELASLSDPGLVVATIARAVGVPSNAGHDLSSALAARLGRQAGLLCVDNCEHLSDAVAALVRDLMLRVPGLRIVVTSQESLRVEGERLYRLGPLAIPAPGQEISENDGAIALMLLRVNAADPHFRLRAGDLPLLAEVCRRLDGIPLALELAAARLPLLGLVQLHRKLDDRFRLLTAGARVVLRRHQTLRATLDWSHALLEVADQMVLRRIAIFAGSFALESCETVATDDHLDGWAVLESLGTLVDKSLVIVTDDMPPRYRLLETTRIYALEKLADSGETEHVAERHAQATLQVLMKIGEGPQRWALDADTLARAAAELDNLRAALAWVDGAPARLPIGVRLAGLSVRVWYVSNLMHEGVSRCMALRERLPPGTPIDHEAALAYACGRLGAVTSRADVFDATRRAVELYRTLGDPSRLYDALTILVASAAERGYLDDAGRAVAEATLVEQAGFPPGQRGGFAWARQRWLRKTGCLQEALDSVVLQAALYREAGNEAAEMMAIGNVAHCELCLGRLVDAETHSRAALARLDAIGSPGHGGHIGCVLALALVLQDKSQEALEAAAAAWPHLRAEGDEIRLLPVAALAAAQQGCWRQACRAMGCIAAVTARLDLVRPPAEFGEDVALQRLLDSVPEEQREREIASGATLDMEAAFAQACDPVSPA